MFFLFLGAREPFESVELERFAHALDIVQSRYPGIGIGQLSTLLHVGLAPQKEGQYVSVTDIVDQSPGQKYPTIARRLDQLGAGTESASGLGLIEKGVDPDDRRNRHVAISNRGKFLLQELDLILAPYIVEKIGKQETTPPGAQS